MKRPLTLTAGILGVVGNAFVSILFLIGLIVFGELFSYVGGGLIIIPILFMLMSIAALIMCIFTIIAWNKAPETFRKRFGLIITAIVLNFILSIYLLITVFVSEGEEALAIFLILFAIVLVSAILSLIDICREKGKVKIAEMKNEFSSQEVSNSVQTTEVATQPVAAPSISSLEEKIEKLNVMKEKGLITEEEYSQLKTSYIKEQLGK